MRKFPRVLSIVHGRIASALGERPPAHDLRLTHLLGERVLDWHTWAPPFIEFVSRRPVRPRVSQDILNDAEANRSLNLMRVSLSQRIERQFQLDEGM